MQAENFKIRRNVMDLSSVEAFHKVKGGYANGCKDVYFLRVVGINEKVLREVEEMDRALTESMECGKGFYNRLNSLPRLAAAEDIAFYAGCYANWAHSGKQSVSIKATGQNQQLCRLLGVSCQKILGLMEQGKAGMNQSMEKNFMVKVLFWLDQTVAAALRSWEPGKSRKAVFLDICKQQEYLFCYLLTLLGMDVLLIQVKQDIPPELEGLGLSRKCAATSSGNCVVPPYGPGDLRGGGAQAEGTMRSVQRDSMAGAPRMVVNVRVPERDRRTKEMLEAQNSRRAEWSQGPGGGRQAASGVRQAMAGGNGMQPSPSISSGGGAGGRPAASGSQVVAAPRRELAYEELALLASSVVQIMIHDGRGEVIGGGSGIMVGRKGYILTNNHVASRGKYYSVRIEEDDKVYQTDEMIKYNSVLDLAVIRVDRRLDPLPIYKGERKLARGQRVVAIGSPLGLFNSVSDGIISGFRLIEDVEMIQFTAPISNGSSGGAVLNMYGEVIGISTAGFDNGQNINLAVGYGYIQNFVRGFVN